MACVGPAVLVVPAAATTSAVDDNADDDDADADDDEDEDEDADRVPEFKCTCVTITTPSRPAEYNRSMSGAKRMAAIGPQCSGKRASAFKPTDTLAPPAPAPAPPAPVPAPAPVPETSPPFPLPPLAPPPPPAVDLAIGSAYASKSPPYVPASSSRRLTSTHMRTSRSLHSTSVVSCARALSSSLALMPCTVRQPGLDEEVEEEEDEAERDPAPLPLPVLSGLAVTVLALDAVIEPEPVAE